MTRYPVEVDLYAASDEPVSTAYDVPGGLQIRVDGERLHRFEREDEMSFEAWEPAYVGSRLHGDVLELVGVVADLLDDTVGIYDTEAVQLDGLSSRFVFEPLSPTGTRIAFRSTANRQRGDHPIVASSACGLPVETSELASEVLDVGEAYLDVLAAEGLRDGQLARGCEDAVDELSTLVEQRAASDR